MSKLNIETLIKRYSKIFSDYLNWDEIQIREDIDKYLKNNKSNINDYLWHIFNKILLIEYKNLDKFHLKQITIYSCMSLFVAEFENKSDLKYSKLLFKMELEKAKIDASNSPNIIWELEIIGDNRCPVGKKYDGIRFPLDGSVSELPLATSECFRNYCSCTTSRVPKRDSNGRIIFNKKL